MTTAPTSSASVSNLVMSWDPPATVPELPALPTLEDRPLAFDAERVLADRRAMPQVPRYELLAEEPAIAWEGDEVVEPHVAPAAHAAPHERRSAYELAFLMLAAALAILVATPPLVQLFLAMRGIQA